MKNSITIWSDVGCSVQEASIQKTLQSLATKFKPTLSDELNRAFELAWKLYVHGYSTEAETLLGFIGDNAFNGDYRLWTWIESSLLLQAWLLRQRGQTQELVAVIEKLKQPENFDFQNELKNTFNKRARQRRLAGSLLFDYAAMNTNLDPKEELQKRELMFMHDLFVYFLADENSRQLVNIEERVSTAWSRINDLINIM